MLASGLTTGVDEREFVVLVIIRDVSWMNEVAIGEVRWAELFQDICEHATGVTDGLDSEFMLMFRDVGCLCHRAYDVDVGIARCVGLDNDTHVIPREHEARDNGRLWPCLVALGR